MLYVFVIIGASISIILFIIMNRFINREKTYRNKLNILLQAKQYISAIELGQKLIALKPHKPEFHFLLADIYYKAKMLPSAIEIYDNMIKNKIFSVKIKEQNIREKIAALHFSQNKVIEAFREAYALYKSDPKSPFALGLLGHIYGSQQKYDRAKDFLRKAIELDPNESEFHCQAGLLYLDTGDLSMGYTELDKAYQLDPGNLKAQYFLALTCRQKGLKEKANSLLEKLNIKNTANLPENITQIGLMTQNIPRFEISQLETKLEEEIQNQKPVSDENLAASLDAFMEAGTEIFYNTVLHIIERMGYSIKENIQNRLIDNSHELDVIAISRKEKNNPQAPRYFIQFTRSKSEIGTIPYADFLSKMHDLKIQNGIFITTSTFNEQIIEKSKKENEKIILADVNKLKKFL